ncbi:MAG TPA: cupin domain-containing protein [Saprospiraceae bacterium]|nr:cupin domain-containing protein [Saprospiraceae bacterium]
MNQVAVQIIEALELKPLTFEGGYYRQTYRSEEQVEAAHLPERYGGHRYFSTAIYYLLTPETFSSLHLLKTDEIFHFYAGDPIEMLLLHEAGSGEVITIGNDILNGLRPQIVVPKGTWQGSRLKDGGSFALLGATMSPGFDMADFATPNKEFLLSQYPQFHYMIHLLTPS